MITLVFLLVAVLMFFVSEIFGDLYPIIQDRFRIAGGITVILLVVWVISSLTTGHRLLPEGFSLHQNRIIIEKCREPC